MTTNYRGAMVAPMVPNADLTDLLDNGANIIRYQITGDVGNLSAEEYSNWVTTHLDYLDSHVIPTIQGRGRIVLDLHSLPGGVRPGPRPRARMFIDRKWALNTWKETWLKIDQRYRTNDAIHVYGLANEFPGNFDEVWGEQYELTSRLRLDGSTKRIALTTPYADPVGFKNTIFSTPLSFKNIWYEAHNYYPTAVAMQGVAPYPYPVSYPAHGRDKSRLLQHLKHIINFSKTLPDDAKIFIGEFSCSTFAKEQARLNLLTDCIDIFEKNNFNWCYHAWREASVWSAEVHTSVLNLLKTNWARNKVK